jgi:1-acyl-sn-glycerol-3-phosphate acyltransferase
MGQLRYLLTLPVATVHHSMRAALAGLRGERFNPGGVYDDAPRAWSRSILKAAGVRVDVSGLEHLPSDQACVIVSNHNSFMDVWVLAAALPGSVRFIAKQELFRIPLLGRAMRASGQISIDRSQLRSAMGAYDDAIARLREGISPVIFAEGTRSRTGALQPFKKGPFVLAIAAQVPVVPVYIAGSREVLPPGSMRVRPGTISLRIGQPIPTSGLTHDDRDRLSARTRAAMESLAASVDAIPAED